jgi:hypothetical protein
MKIIDNLADIFKVKTIMTLAMTFGMIMLLSGKWTPDQAIIALFSASFGSVITYFFTKKEGV